MIASLKYRILAPASLVLRLPGVLVFHQGQQEIHPPIQAGKLQLAPLPRFFRGKPPYWPVAVSTTAQPQ
jgi:hypothetical protein